MSRGPGGDAGDVLAAGGMPAQCSPSPGRGWLAREGDLLEEAAGRDILPAGAGAANAETCAHTGNWMRCSPRKSAASPAACLDLQTIVSAAFLPRIFKTMHNFGEGTGAHSLTRTRGTALLWGFELRCSCT